MSSNRDYNVVHSSEMEVNGDRNEVFRGHSTKLNSLNQQDSLKLEEDLLEDTRDAEEIIVDESPFGGSSTNIHHSLEVSNNYDCQEAEDLLEAGEGKDIDYNSEGDIYNVSLNEVFSDYSFKQGIREVNGQTICNLDVDAELLNVHMVVYDDPDDGQHLVHWDPAVWNSEGEKEKYEDDNGPSNQTTTVDQEHNSFTDDSNYELEDGLCHIEDELNRLSELYFEDASRAENLEEVSEYAWMSQRWDAMQEAVSNFRLIQAGETSKVSFFNQSNNRGYL